MWREQRAYSWHTQISSSRLFFSFDDFFFNLLYFNLSLHNRAVSRHAQPFKMNKSLRIVRTGTHTPREPIGHITSMPRYVHNLIVYWWNEDYFLSRSIACICCGLSICQLVATTFFRASNLCLLLHELLLYFFWDIIHITIDQILSKHAALLTVWCFFQFLITLYNSDLLTWT